MQYASIIFTKDTNYAPFLEQNPAILGKRNSCEKTNSVLPLLQISKKEEHFSNVPLT